MIPQQELGYNNIFRGFFFNHPLTFIGIILLGELSVLFALVTPLIFRSLIDDVFLGNKSSLLAPIAGVFIIIIVISAFAIYYSGIIRGQLSIVLFNELSTTVFQNIQNSTQHDIQQFKIGDLQSRMISNIITITQTAVNTIPQLFIAILSILFPLIIMFSLDPNLTLFVVFPIIFYILSSWYFGKQMRLYQRPVLDSSANLQAFLKDSLTCIAMIRVYNLESWNQQRYQNALSMYNAASLNAVRINSQNSAVSLLIDETPALIVVIVGSIEFLNGRISLGTLTAFLGYVGLFFSPIEQISNLWSNYKATHASYDRIEELFLLKKTAYGNDCNCVSPEKIEIIDVSFSYNNRTIFNNFSVTFSQGINYIIGDNGSGKTTLTYLLCGIYSPEKGRIMINGQEISSFTQESLRSMISVVFSEPMIFNGTIFDNIHVGNLKASRDSVMSSAIKANINEYIMKLPNQYDTLIGESGICLSSGEMQKIALARAILRDAPILILDEFTRSIDIESRKSILAITHGMKDKIIIIITHNENDIDMTGNIITI